MDINNQICCGDLCGELASDENDERMEVYLIIIIALLCALVLAVAVDVVVWRRNIKPKTHTHNMAGSLTNRNMGNAKSKNRIHLFRLQSLIIDGGHLVLRRVLKSKLQVQNTTLAGSLGQERRTITRLKAQKTVTPVQYNLLYPPGGGQAPSTSDLDITLIICLLRNLKICGLNQRFNWSVKPQTGDISMEADMYRLKQFRNEIAHISSTTGIDLKSFVLKWTKIEQQGKFLVFQKILLRLNSAIHNPVPNLQQKVNEIKTSPVDPEAEKRIDKAIEEWREMEKGLEVGMELIKSDLNEVKKDTADNTEQIKDTQRRVTDNEECINYTQSRVTDIEECIRNTQSKVTDTEERIRNTQSKVTDIESHISKAQEDGSRRKHRDVKEDLITFYTSEHRTILLDPLFEEKDTPIVKFYVMPDMKRIEETLPYEERKFPIGSLSDVFMKDGEFSREVYLTADAGYGKTAYSKYLALIWCQAHSPDSKYTEYFDKDHLNAMRQFELLFLVLLRDSSDDCSIDEMIFNQIIKETSNSGIMNMSSLQAVLHRERHLVILDGLDEWTHPERKCKRSPKSIPHRNARKNCVILTTTRPWKLGVINLKTSQISKKIELAKLSSVSAKKLKKRAISEIKGLDIRKAGKLVKKFNAEVEKCCLGDLASVPLLLIYLIYLWCHNIPLGNSRCGLYTSITELLLSRTVKKYPHIQPTPEHSQIEFPQWLISEHCRKYFSLLTALGRLAFHTLFGKTRENTLVFDRSVAETFLRESELKFNLQSGILSQSKVQVTVLKQSSKISFAHKSVQEYFSALYMSCQNESDVQKIIQENCKSLQDILDMSAVFVFISGMNGKMISTISRELTSVISENEETIAHRSRTKLDYCSPLKDIQNMYICCIKENPENNDLKLHLQNVLIDRECRQENYNTTLQRLAKQNKNNIKSVSIKNKELDSLHKIIDSFELTDLNHLQKLNCLGKCEETDIVRLLSGTVKYADFVSPDNSCSMTSTLCRRFQTLHQLEGIYIDNFEMSHDVLDEFLNYLTNRKSMKQIKLRLLSCTDHGTYCDGVTLNLLQHTELRTLELRSIPLSQLNINVASLEEFFVGFSQLPSASKLNRLMCGNLQTAADIEILLQTLPLLVHVKEVELYSLNLGERSLILSPQMVSIEYIWLSGVRMSSSSSRDLVKHVEQLPHSVKVEINRCDITPENEFETVKQYVRNSENFVVTMEESPSEKNVQTVTETDKLIRTRINGYYVWIYYTEFE